MKKLRRFCFARGADGPKKRAPRFFPASSRPAATKIGRKRHKKEASVLPRPAQPEEHVSGNKSQIPKTPEPQATDRKKKLRRRGKKTSGARSKIFPARQNDGSWPLPPRVFALSRPHCGMVFFCVRRPAGEGRDAGEKAGTGEEWLAGPASFGRGGMRVREKGARRVSGRGARGRDAVFQRNKSLIHTNLVCRFCAGLQIKKESGAQKTANEQPRIFPRRVLY